MVILIQIAFKSVHCLGQYGHFKNINSSNPRTWNIFLQFPSSLFYGFQNIDLSRSWFSLFLCILFFNAIVNEIVFVLYHSDSSLLVCRKAAGFHILISYSETLVNLCISSNGFWVETLGFSTYSVMFSANHDSFISFLPI